VARVYLETSFVSACVTDRTDVRSLYRREASLEWWAEQSSRHSLFISAEVMDELANPAHRRARESLEFVAAVPLLPIDEGVHGLAKILVRETAMPGPAKGDAIHVAVACIHGMEYMLSWNVRHLANPNKIEHLRRVCLRVGVVPPRILTPDLLWEGPSRGNAADPNSP
jgi:hypothetical protein